ncbi:constitutive coactivator of peroxisome proliferator-activated receptor gamma-like isoform X1 [Glandiceps talaboti]
MGVKGLQGYIEKCCPQAMVKVSLTTIGHRYFRQHGKPAVLVVDGMSCLRMIYHPGIAWVYGGQWKQYIEQLENFLKAFERAKIEPVFFFDGRVENNKRSVWVERRISDRKKIAKIFEHIKRTGNEPGQDLFNIPVSLPKMTRMALRSLGATVYNTKGEADYEIAKYCKEFQCLGILGQDTDFIIYNIGEYFSSQYLDLNSLTTVSYSRQALCAKLRMPIYQLPLLACLMGNDFISREDLEDFHKYLARGRVPWFQKFVPVLANYAASFGNRLLSKEDIRYIESEVFRDRSKFGLIQESVSMYYLEADDVGETLPPALHTIDATPSSNLASPPVHSEVLELAKQQHKKSENRLWNIMVTGIEDCGVSFEDDDDPSLPSSSPLLLPVRQRMYGLLYGVGVQGTDDDSGQTEQSKITGGRVVRAEKEDAGREAANFTPNCAQRRIVGQNAVMEWHVYRGNALKEPDIVAALPLDSLTGGTPSMEYLWLQNGPEVTECRLRTYLACMDCSISMTTMQQIPQEYIIPCTLINYFLKSLTKDVFGEVELNAFLAVFVTLPMYDVDRLISLEVATVKSKAIHLATVFMRGVTTVLTLNSACGKPVAMEHGLPWKYFDGKLFHAKYLIALQGTNEFVLCEKNERTINLFRLLKQCVLEGRR